MVRRIHHSASFQCFHLGKAVPVPVVHGTACAGPSRQEQLRLLNSATLGCAAEHSAHSLIQSIDIGAIVLWQFDVMSENSFLSTYMLLRYLAQADYCVAVRFYIRGVRFNEDHLSGIQHNKAQISARTAVSLCEGEAEARSALFVELVLVFRFCHYQKVCPLAGLKLPELKGKARSF